MTAATPVPDLNRKLVIAPMMELTDRHFRFLARQLTRHTLLYTEMLTAKAVIHGDRDYLLDTDADDAPLVLQLGGSDPVEMAEAATIGEAYGYNEININCGCPSDRVKSGRFGACLMAEPELVNSLVSTMQSAVKIPVSVKCRLGIDRDDSYQVVEDFVRKVADGGCESFVVHARKAWLDGLSPRENRTVPPLRYEYVYRLKEAFPHLHITINGGLDTWDGITQQLEQVDGVMIGRQAYYHPSFLGEADTRIFFDAPEGKPVPDIDDLKTIARSYAHYMQGWMEQGVRLSALSRHLVALFQEVPGARLWRRHLSEQASKSSSAITLVDDALEFIDLAQRKQSA